MNWQLMMAAVLAGFLGYTVYVMNTPEQEPECHKPQLSEILK